MIKIKEISLIFYIQVIKISLCFLIGLKSKFIEQQWTKKVFLHKDTMLAGIFTEAQQHRINSFHIRK